MAQSIIANTVVATGGRLVNGVAGFLVIALVAKILPTDDVGRYLLVLSYAIIIQLLADGGLYLVLSKKIAETKQQTPDQALAQVLSVRLILLVVAFIFGGLLLTVIPSLVGLKQVYLVAAFGLAAQSISQLTMSVYQFRQEVWRATVSDLTGRLLQISIVVYLFIQGATSVTVLMAAFTAGAILQLLINWYFMPQTYKRIKPQFDFQVVKELLLESWPIAALLLINAVYFRVDSLILSLFRSLTDVAHYGLAYRIIEAGLFFPAMLGGLLLPRLAESLEANDKKKAGRYLGEGFSLLAIFSILIVIALLFGARQIISVVGGADFAAARVLLQVLGLALAAMFLGNLFGFTLIALRRQQAMLKLYFFLMVINLVLNFIFIPKFGALAAAWTTVITESVAATVAAIMVYKEIPYKLSWKFNLLLKKP